MKPIEMLQLKIMSLKEELKANPRNEATMALLAMNRKKLMKMKEELC